MPAKAKPIRAPRAKKKKVWIHTFYLFQPVLQFFALIAVMLILARCSPLAPSTEKTSELAQTPGQERTAEAAEAAAMEQAFQESLRSLGVAEMEVMSHSDMRKISRNAPHADTAINESSVRAVIQQKNAGAGLMPMSQGKPVLVLPLDPVQQEALFVYGTIRIDLSERLKKASTKENARKLLMGFIADSAEHQGLEARAIFVLPDASMQQLKNDFTGWKLPLKVSYSMPSGEKAFIEVSRVQEDGAAVEFNAALLALALEEAQQLAILLE